MSMITIFEGPDGGGKTTAAQDFAKLTGARYVHFGPLKHVTSGLPRLYVEAMLPALLGYQHVVMDRSWLSEPIYGRAFRGDKDRMHPSDYRMLERLAMRCAATVIRCLPPFSKVLDTWLSRRQDEMLDKSSQLEAVYNGYRNMTTSLPIYDYDYTKGLPFNGIPGWLVSHPVDMASAGNWDASVVLVGESFADHKNLDPLYQWPFGSFSDEGCSRWLTSHLDDYEISEHELFWLNADQINKNTARMFVGRTVVALGAKALEKMHKVCGPEDGIDLRAIEHPQAWKRFRASEGYGLGPLLRELLHKDTRTSQ